MFSDRNPEFLRPVTSDEFLPPIGRWTTLGGLFLVGTVGAAFALAAVTEYNVTVKAPATVRPSGEVRIVQAATEGTVKSISVTENMAVKEGDAIATIDDSQVQTKKSQLIGSIQQNQLQLAQIAAQLNSLQNQLVAESNGTERTIASAQADLERNEREYRDRQITTASEVQQAEANLKIAQAELQKAQEELQREQANLLSADANLKGAEANLKSAISRRDRYKPLAESGAISKDRLEENELAVQQQEQTVAGQKAAIEAQKKAIEGQAQTVERQKQSVEVAAAKLQAVKTALNPTKAPIAIAQQRIAQEKAKGEATLATLKKEREALIQRRIEIENQINRDRKEIQQIETELTKSIVRSPADGTILQLYLRNAGQTVRSGEAIAQISPSNAPIVIKARVAAEDIAKITLGQKSLLRVSAYAYTDYGVLQGKVSAIAPDAITSQNNNSPYYEVTIQPEKAYLLKGDIQYPVQPGMEITADIISREETVLTFIMRKARLLTDL
ncbi:HlyD family efflux transporter periplasmic adaptor subunit [Planktothrix sp. FACHB-1355]|uniref:HlyD family efflux transporter periplasmic adaptor subunit n=1 Tax=Aerosakkonema funiforme FACHB-1375 TaxID=2949571 RepID=A0A926VJV9_9CYAN|nr:MULTISPECIES: HlyD family efflux transporter periplasmic adaptor subunit [Oscillatoriales]MBD2183794.1 HlyD family efflux transporter periplasmic adaptor subunit [Aerosakkonema funiforme FACHB-1375]MBD3560153.1 HlyD family efflux transporter periplasmic adaptor subunit [Planktothrix sp. FACHB-1355]